MQLKKKFYLREAVTLYTKGLDMDATLPELLSVLHSNRAQAHAVLSNWRSALQDSQKALQLDAANLKVRPLPYCDDCSCCVGCCCHICRPQIPMSKSCTWPTCTSPVARMPCVRKVPLVPFHSSTHSGKQLLHAPAQLQQNNWWQYRRSQSSLLWHTGLLQRSQGSTEAAGL